MKFIADDGKIFDTMEECKEYERINSEGKEIAQLWYNHITTYDATGHMIESSYDYTKETKDYLDDTYTIIVNDTVFLTIDCTSCEWEKIKKYLDKEYGVILPSYARDFFRYSFETEQWVSFHKDYEEFKEKWSSIGVRF